MNPAEPLKLAFRHHDFVARLFKPYSKIRFINAVDEVRRGKRLFEDEDKVLYMISKRQ